MCRAGFGIAQLPLLGVAPYFAAGLLVQVLPDYVPVAMPINLLYPHRRNAPATPRSIRGLGADAWKLASQQAHASFRSDSPAGR
jgi:DNA-binding transcriptional LysR family regulator